MPALPDPQDTFKQLNRKFAGFIEKVHLLEERNSELEAQITDWMRRRAQEHQACCDSDQQLRELRQSVHQSIVTNGRLALLLERTQTQAAQLQTRCTLERSRQELLRAAIRTVRRMNEEFELESEELGKKTQRQRQELVALRQTQRQQVVALQPRWAPGTQPVSEEDETRGGMEVSQLLTDIRTHYANLIHSTPTVLSAGSKAQPPYPTGVDMSNGDKSLRAARAELNDAKRQWHSLQVEMDSLQALEKGLESSLHATKQRYKLQLHGLKSVITELEAELQEVRRDIEHQVQEHQTLLNTKMRLEWEIATYRSLLEREERRLCSNGPESSITNFTQREMAASSAAVLENHLEQKIKTVTRKEILDGNVVRQSAEACGKIQTERVDEVIKEWEGSFFKDNPHLRKKSVSLRFDLHLAATDEGCSQTKLDSLPNIEVRLVMRKSSSIPSLKA